MSVRDLLVLVVTNLGRMRARVILTATGVIIGTAAVVLLVSLSVGVQRNLSSELEMLGDLTLIEVNPGAADQGPGNRRAQQATRLDDKALEAIRALPHVVVVTARSDLQGLLELKMGRDSTVAPFVRGIDPAAAPKLGWRLQSGLPRLGRGQVVVGPRLFENSGGFFMIAGAGGAMVTEDEGEATSRPRTLQDRALPAELTRYDSEGQPTTRSERLRVVGVFEPGGGMDDVAVYMARADVEAYNQWLSGERRSAREGYQGALVKVDAPERVREVQESINATGLSSYSSMDIAEGLGRVFLVIRLVLGGVGAIALLVAAFGIANTMTMAIYERTKEIGIMKAVGATNLDVLRIFLFEAGAIGVLGGVLGVLLGWLGGKGVNLALQVVLLQRQQAAPSADAPPTLIITPLWLSLFAIAFAALIGLASGIYPALRAASMRPLGALRTE